MAERNLRHRVLGYDLAFIINHIIRIAVVRCKKNLTILRENGIGNLAHKSVERLYRLDCGIKDSSMTDHIRICEIQDNKVVFVLVNLLDNGLCDLGRTHLRLKVIGLHLWRRYENSVLARIWLFHASVEKESYMCVLLCFGDTKLLKSKLGYGASESWIHILRWKSELDIWHCRIVFRHANVCQILELLASVEAVEIRINKGSCYLSCSVRSEVDENNRIPVLDWSGIYYSWKHEFVSFVLGIGLLDCLLAISCT